MNLTLDEENIEKHLFFVKCEKKTFAIVLLYLVTFLPIAISFFAVFSKRDETDFDQVKKKWFKRLSCLAFFNSCIAPFIYSTFLQH